MPIPILPALALAQTGYQIYQGYKQGEKADELQRKGPADIVPAAYKAMLQNQANQANNSQIAGYGKAIDNLNEQQATTIGEARRAGISSSNLLNVLTRVNQQGSAERRRLAMAGAQAQEERQRLYNQGLLGKAQMDEQARQENQRAIAALRGAKAQNYYNAFTSGIGALGYGMNGMKSSPNAGEPIETMTPRQASLDINYETPERVVRPVQVPKFESPNIYPGMEQFNNTYTPEIYRELYQRKYGQ